MVSESLVVIYPIGSWCKHPKEIPAIVNRLKKTTPELPTAGQAQFGDVDLQQLIEEQDVGAEHVTLPWNQKFTQKQEWRKLKKKDPRIFLCTRRRPAHWQQLWTNQRLPVQPFSIQQQRAWCTCRVTKTTPQL